MENLYGAMQDPEFWLYLLDSFSEKLVGMPVRHRGVQLYKEKHGYSEYDGIKTPRVSSIETEYKN